MKGTKNVEDSLPIEILQKGLIITEEEIKNNPILKLTVNKYYYNFIFNIISYIGNRGEYFFKSIIHNKCKRDFSKFKKWSRWNSSFWSKFSR